MRAGAAVASWAALLLLLAGFSCAPEGHSGDKSPPPPASAAPDPLSPLHAFEEARRAASDFAHLPPSDRAFGADPTAIRPLPGKGPARYAGILRGRDAVVLLDDKLAEIARAPAPASPTGLAVSSRGEIFVSGEQSSAVSRYRESGAALRPAGTIEITGARALRDVAVGGENPEILYAVDEHNGRLIAQSLREAPPRAGAASPGAAVRLGGSEAGADERREIAAGHGPFRVARRGDQIIVDSLLDHALSIYRLDARGFPLVEGAITIRHDGPIWGFDAISTPQGLLIAAGGVEDHPLDRTGGSFGFIDSFVFLYRIGNGATAAERLAEINASSLGVITPKAIALRETKTGFSATVAGAGGDQLLEMSWGADLSAKPELLTRPILPGVAMLAIDAEGAAVFADPLFDGWGKAALGDKDAKEAPPLVLVEEPKGAPAPPRSAASRLGEALFFTKLMAPWNSAEGRLSRFTCETCHFEGYVDGRTHSTGRGDIRATTKPLLGLFNNRPHFSRALDPDMATMVHNEFRVAGSLSGHDPWFEAPQKDLPWISAFHAAEAELGPEALRRALMTFLMEFTHRPNPSVLGRAAWSAEERAGAEVFRDRCERCHSARLVSDVPASRVAFEGWEALIFAREGALVWGRSGYEKTGILPYVHEGGARVPSLRRLFKKWPYFTNGSAKSLGDVLDRARFGAADAAVFYHDGAPAGEALVALGDADKRGLLAFLDLL